MKNQNQTNPARHRSAFQTALQLLVMAAVGAGATITEAQTNAVTGFIRAPGTYDLGKGAQLEIANQAGGGLDIQLMWGPHHGAGSHGRTPVKPGSWFIFVESPEMVWLAFDGGNDLRVMMTDESGYSGFGGVYADLFETCPKELREALPAGAPKNLTSNNVPVRSMMGGESLDGVGIHIATGKGNEPPQIWGIVRASPAAMAGIKPGSFLLSINGTNSMGYSGDQCRRLVGGRAGTTVKLEIADPARQQTNQIMLERRRSLIAD